MADIEYPRWKFRYNRFKGDPRPDILLLGSWKHPRTGNTLIGGINLNYCTDKEINQLRKALDKFASATSLYQRYHIGLQLFPQIFKNKYRTYKATEIAGLNKDKIYPAMGILQKIGSYAKKAYDKMLGRKPTVKQIKDLETIEPETYDDMSEVVSTPQEFDDKLDVALKDVQQTSTVQPPQVQQATADANAASKARIDTQQPTVPVAPKPQQPIVAPKPILPPAPIPAVKTQPPVKPITPAKTPEKPKPAKPVKKSEPQVDLLDQEPKDASLIQKKIDQALSLGDKNGGNARKTEEVA